MATKTYAQRLQLVRDAIDDIVTSGQGMSEDGRDLRMADLNMLRELEKDYERRADEEAAKAANACRGRNRAIYVEQS